MEMKGVFVLVLWMMMIMVVSSSSVAKTDEKAAPPPPPPLLLSSYWLEEIRKLVNGASSYLFPPKLDFRPGKPVEEDGGVKEALTNSFQKTKQIVQDSAKAAADTLQQQQTPPPHSEL